MGVLETLFGSGGTADAEQKYAILLSAGPEDAPVANNAFNYALEFADAGYEVNLFLDGQATKWPGAFAENPDLPFAHDWERIRTSASWPGPVATVRARSTPRRPARTRVSNFSATR